MTEPLRFAKIEVVGIVLAVEVENLPDPSATPYVSPGETIGDQMSALGFDVQSVSPHIDGMYRVEVLSS